ncbi:ASCH domain-containing protein [Azospirillum brasilense]|uniref:ASCH domain-containing protein n=1 Tax=Azospirillum argentinense TaxID=2970906 RepID=UPI00190E89F9|nr:ASCH domain-containing protein [Azospirillum argentinense]MBK3802741.1 ASCH domain-containing protein [Azospirillum argentinense]
MRSLPTKALSVRAPWWWFILHGGKDIENRDWQTDYRGPVLLHASKWWRQDGAMGDIEEAASIMRAAGFRPLDSAFPKDEAGQPVRRLTPAMLKAPGGCIVGMVDIVGCVERSDSPWFFGRFGLQLVNPVAFATPIPCKGMLGFFNVSDDVLDQVRVQIGEVRP